MVDGREQVELGSSLRVQGGPRCLAMAHALLGFIPARAGRTADRAPLTLKRRVHPCACRADCSLSLSSTFSSGSSLRVQGGPPATPSPRSSVRFIPARAGRTWGTKVSRSKLPVHPCACRADMTGSTRGVPSAGSSLRVQGGQATTGQRGCCWRFIPARAGRTLRARQAVTPVMVHPCACRADESGERKLDVIEGSSLRVQGGPQCSNLAGEVVRFIPARAGRTVRQDASTTINKVHPCACRADLLRRVSRTDLRGSSLRVQGGPAAGGLLVMPQGFIPARAGRTPTASVV